MIKEGSSPPSPAQRESQGSPDSVFGATGSKGRVLSCPYTHVNWNGSILTSGAFNFCLKLILKRIPMAFKSLKTLLFTNAKEKSQW